MAVLPFSMIAVEVSALQSVFVSRSLKVTRSATVMSTSSVPDPAEVNSAAAPVSFVWSSVAEAAPQAVIIAVQSMIIPNLLPIPQVFHVLHLFIVLIPSG
ncbi:hypothetical protein D3C76_1343550 [compost metagenome]